jgi:ABC-type multidrug transport system fused ATPase/permease subunit
MGSFKLIYPFIHKYKFHLVIYTICILLSYPLESIVIPKIFSSFFETIRNNNINNNQVFIEFFKKLFIFMIIITIAHAINSKLDIFLIPEFSESITNQFFEKIVKHYQNNYTDLELGKILTRINGLPTVLREVTTDLFNWIIPKLFTIIIINIYFFTVNQYIGLTSISLLSIIILYNLNTFNSCVELCNTKYNNFEDKSEQLQDKLSNLYSIYSSGNVDYEINEYNNISKEFKKSHRDALNCSYTMKTINSYFTSLTLITLSILLVYLYINKQINNETLVTIFLILIFYTPCLNAVITYLPDYSNHLGILKSLDEFIDDISISQNIKDDIIITNGKIDIINLKFGYTEETKIFNNFNLSINSTEKVAIVGPSGNGKTTLVKILMGYYHVDDGTIFIDGQDINKHNLNSLRKQISYINQNTKLFNKTIFENIKYGNNISSEDIHNVYEKYNLDRVFKNLSDGFNTNVGVNGDSLSGGQKQIILLLRNYFKPTQIYIMDEPTAALDNETRKVVLNIIKDITKNATLLIITHDDNNLEIVDRKIKLINGQIF